MKFLNFFYVSVFPFFLVAQENNQSEAETESPTLLDSSTFDSSFFSGVLDQNYAVDDPMGTQRLIDLRGTVFSPNISFSTNYNYTNILIASIPIISLKKMLNNLKFSATLNFW